MATHMRTMMRFLLRTVLDARAMIGSFEARDGAASGGVVSDIGILRKERWPKRITYRPLPRTTGESSAASEDPHATGAVISIWDCCWTRERMEGVNRAARPLPEALASYMAVSASRRASAAVRWPRSLVMMP